MNYIPKGRDAWVGFLLLPFKVWVVAVPVWRFAASVGISDRLTAQYFGGELVTAGAMLCIPVLLLGALVQAAFCSRGKVWWTLGFVAFGFLFLPPSRLGLSPALVNNTSLALSLVVTSVSVFAYLRLKWRALLLLAGGNLLGAGNRLAHEFAVRADTDYGIRRLILELGMLASLAAQILIAAGIVLVIRHALTNVQTEGGDSAR